MSTPRALDAPRPSLASAIYVGLGAGVVLLTLVLRYPSLFEPRWYGDEGIFAAIAQNIRSGRSLYSEAWDNKPPLIFFTYAAVQSPFGTSVFALHAVATAVVIATQCALMAAAALLFGVRRALVAGAIFALLMGTPVIEANLAMTETFMILPATLAVLLVVLADRVDEGRRLPYYVGAGILLGVASGYKQVAVFDLIAVAMIVAFVSEHPAKLIAALVAGFAVPQAALAVVFATTGAFPQYWYAVVGSLGLYAELSSAGPFVRLAGYLPAMLVVAYLLRRRYLGGDVTLRHFPMLWLGFGIAGATSSTFEFPHYLQQAVPAACLLLVSDPWPKETDDLGRIALAVTGLLVVALVFGQFSYAFRARRQLDPVEYYRTFASHRWGTMSDLDYDYYFDGKVVAVNDIVRSIDDDRAGDTAFTWSELPWIYAAGELKNPTRFYTSFLGEVVPGAKTEIMRDLEATPPAYIVVSDDTYAPFAELDRFIEARYELTRAQGDWRLYRLADAAQARDR